MKPPRFEYHDPTTLDEVLELLAQYGPDARVLAGGQSLMPLLNFRLARPTHLIDLNRVMDLTGLEVDDCPGLTIGAMARQRMLERSALVADRCPPMVQSMPYVGHAQIRNRGTLGGSVAHADPAAELPAVMVAADAVFTLSSKRQQRTVQAADFFTGNLATVLCPDEVLVRIDLPAWPARAGSSVREVAIRLGDFALAGVVTTLTCDPDGRVARARIVCFGVEDRPVQQVEAEQSLEGALPTDSAFTEAGRIVSARVHPADDIHASAAYRRRVAGVLTARALADSMTRLAQAVA